MELDELRTCLAGLGLEGADIHEDEEEDVGDDKEEGGEGRHILLEYDDEQLADRAVTILGKKTRSYERETPSKYPHTSHVRFSLCLRR